MSDLVPEGWSSATLSDLVVLQYGKSPKDVMIDGGEYPIIGTGGVTGYASDYLHDGHTTVIGRKGTINRPSFILNKFWAIDTTYIATDYKEADPKWFYYGLNNIDLTKYNEASGVPSLNRDTLYAIPFKCPPLPEQQKIAAILSSVDEVIEKTQAQINKLKDLKTGMMQELLSPREGQATNINNPQGESKNSLHHTEFKDSPLGRIPIGWEVESIEDVLDRIIDYRGKSPPKSEIGVPLITAKNIRQGFINKEPREYIYEEKFEAWMVRGIPRHGDIFITTEAPLGNIARVPKYKFAIGQRVLTLSPKVTVTSDYLFYVMQGTCFKEQLDLQSTGSTVAGIKQSTFRKIKLPIPPIFEQEYITKPLNALNQRIDTVSVKLDHYKNLKKALMQDLLTGKVRVKVEAA